MLFTIYQFHVHIIMSISFTLTVNPVKLSSTVQYHAKRLHLNQYHVSTVIYTHTITVNHSVHWLLILWLQPKILVHCPGKTLSVLWLVSLIHCGHGPQILAMTGVISCRASRRLLNHLTLSALSYRGDFLQSLSEVAQSPYSVDKFHLFEFQCLG